MVCKRYLWTNKVKDLAEYNQYSDLRQVEKVELQVVITVGSSHERDLKKVEKNGREREGAE